jgi:transposase-like protein
MTRYIQRYSKEFQEEAIQLALRSKSIDQTARDLGIPISTLHGWIQRLSRKQHPAGIHDAKALHEALI